MSTNAVTIVRDLPCVLTETEIQERRRFAVDLLGTIDELEDKKKAATADLNAKIKAHKADMRKAVKEARAGTVERSVECHQIEEFRTNEVKVIRKDTGEVVESRTMTAAELQTEIPGAVTPSGNKRRLKGKGKANGSDEAPGDGEDSAGAGAH